MRTPRTVRGLTLVETAVVLLALLLLTSLALPAITAATCDARKNVSIRNLQSLHMAHALYAADWSDRQFTLVRDDLDAFGSTFEEACEALAGGGECHPPIIAGEDCDGVLRGYFFGCGRGGCSQFPLVAPIVFPDSAEFVGLGSFRIPNARGFHEYVNGRFFDPTFYAPKDPIYEEVAPFFDADCEFVAEGAGLVLSSSYVLSPAAMYHPDVLSLSPFDEYYQSPFDLPGGFESPTVSQARYPAQKSRMLEHYWLQNPPEPCNINFTGCVPYFFNHGLHSIPMTLFFDGHVAGLSVFEAIRSEARVLAQSGVPLWSRDTPFGQTGYLIDDAYDFAETSFHILTIDGIRGRDTLE